MNELNAALYSKLSGGTALTTLLGGTAIYHQQAPDGKPLPYVVFSTQSIVDDNATNNRTKDALVYVRAYAASGISAGSIDAACDALLHDSPVTVSGYSVFWQRRDGDIELVENLPNGGKIFSSGATYRIRLDKS